MSTAKSATEELDISRYLEGPDRYINFAEEVLGVRLAEQQKQILRAVVEHDRIIVMCGNGVGKSYIVAVLKLAFLETNLDSTVLGTSGSYSQYVDAVWRPMKKLHKQAKQRVGLPGETYDAQQPTLEVDDDWFAKVVSPRDPGDLEGRHAADVLVVIEEADKQYITAEHFDSAGSSVTDENDRMIAISNPPEDETDVVYDKLNSDRWHTIQFNSLDSHNVRVEAGEIDDEKIPGLVELSTIKDDWEEWNGEPWPGLEEARTAHERRDDLDTRWYRRRAGVIPPANAAAKRPFYTEDVDRAFQHDRRSPPRRRHAQSIGVDVARKGGDSTVVGEIYSDYITVHAWDDTDHNENESAIRDLVDEHNPVPLLAVDAVGEGSALADRLSDHYEVLRFKNGTKPHGDAQKDYADQWTRGMTLLGELLQSRDVIPQPNDTYLREELYTAARVVKIQRKNRRSGDVEEATSKSKVKERLGRSPDRLDALVMAAYAYEEPPGREEKPSGSGTW